MPDLHPHCRIPNCLAPPTYVLVTERHSWHREAMRADLAPDIVKNNIIEIQNPGLVEHGKPQPYYCKNHAEEKTSHGPN